VLTATVGELPKTVGTEQEFLSAGASVRELTPSAALANYLPDTNGVEVTGVRAGSPFDSAEPRIQSGDIVRSVDGHKVTNIESLRKALTAVRGTQYPVFILRKDESVISIVKPDDPKPAEDGGDLPQAWLGVKTQVMVPDLAKALGVPDQAGFRITEVYPWTEASKAGLKAGDIITQVNDTKLEASRPQDAEDLRHAVEDLTVGGTARIGIMRSGKAQTIPVKLEPTPTASTDTKSAKQKEFEFGVREITLTDKAENHWSKDQTGLLVTDVTAGGWAHIGGLHPDDLIVSINDTPVPTVDAFKHVMASIMKSHPKDIRLFVHRDYLTQFVFIEPDWTKLLDSE
jgi:serine protease Do